MNPCECTGKLDPDIIDIRIFYFKPTPADLQGSQAICADGGAYELIGETCLPLAGAFIKPDHDTDDVRIFFVGYDRRHRLYPGDKSLMFSYTL